MEEVLTCVCKEQTWFVYRDRFVCQYCGFNTNFEDFFIGVTGLNKKNEDAKLISTSRCLKKTPKNKSSLENLPTQELGDWHQSSFFF